MQEENLILVKEFCTHHKVEMLFIQELTKYGIIETVIAQEEMYIPAEQLSHLEKMIRLHYDLDINIEGLDVIRHLLDRMEVFQNELKDLKNRLRFYETVSND